MRLTPPTKNVFWISVVLVVLAVVAEYLYAIPFVADYTFLVVLLGYLLLAAGNAFKGF